MYKICKALLGHIYILHGCKLKYFDKPENSNFTPYFLINFIVKQENICHEKPELQAYDLKTCTHAFVPLHGYKVQWVGHRIMNLRVKSWSPIGMIDAR